MINWRLQFDNNEQEEGFSILELVISLAVFAVIIVLLTDTVLINMRISMVNRARSRAREETGFMLTQIKRDVRNASEVKVWTDYTGCTDLGPTLEILTDATDLNNGTGKKHYIWIKDPDLGTITKYEFDDSISTLGLPHTACDVANVYDYDSNSTLITRMAGDVSLTGWDVLLANNVQTPVTGTEDAVQQIIIKISSKVEFVGSEDSLFSNSVTVNKQTIVATRNFEVERY